MNIKIFQGTIDEFFDSMDAMKRYQEVLLFVYNLVSNPEPLITHVCETWIAGRRKSSGRSLIESMFREAGLQVSQNLIHSQLINYYDHSKTIDTTPVHIPCKHYVFIELQENLSCTFYHKDKEIPECNIRIANPVDAQNVLRVCQQISKNQQIKQLSIDRLNCLNDLPEPEVFNLSQETQSVKLTSCTLPLKTLNHLMLQINKCSSIREIILGGTFMTGCLSSLVPDPHPGLPQLEKLNLWHTRLNKDDLQHLLGVAHKLPKLKELDLSEYTLTGCLSCFLPESHPGLPQMDKLNLWHTRLNEDDLQRLLGVAHKLPKLKELDLSEYTLTGCLSNFLPDPHPGLPELEKLNLWHTRLNKDDLQHLLGVAHKLPKLKELDLSEYTLTGCLSNFLPNPHPGLPQLEKLNLWHTRLNKDDLQHLLGVAHKLPKLKELHLLEYTLTGCLSNFLPDPHPGLPQLQKLSLDGTGLNKDDVQHLLSVAHKLPKLKEFDLSGYTLTGCLCRFLPNPHPGLPQLQKLNLHWARLNEEDLQHLSNITQSNKLPNLQGLNLSGNTLTGCLSNFLPDPHPGLPQLQKLSLDGTGLNKDDAQHLLSVAHKLPKLKELDLSEYTLTGCLSNFLPDPYPGLPQLQKLYLWNTGLNKDDLRHLSNITQGNKLQKLQKLDLAGNDLTGCLSSFLPDPHPGLPQLQKLYLWNTGLNKDDLQHLSNITQSNKLPNLQELDLLGNNLTGCLSSFLPDPHPGLPQLELLNLNHTRLNRDDLQHLFSITQSNKLPKLQKLDLAGNDLTGCLSSFLPDPHPGLPQLQKLDLEDTALNKDDLQHLTHLIQTQNLPRLEYFDLRCNGLSGLESELEKLIETCITHHKVQMKLRLWFIDISIEFKIKWRNRCKGTNIQLYFS